MNNVNMAGMNAMGGPVGGGNPMMNNGAPGGPRTMPTAAVPPNPKSQLNTYIYEYFLTNGMYDVARTLLNSEKGQVQHKQEDSPGRRRDENGNIVGNGADSMDGDSKDDIDSKRPDDLPVPNIPKETPESCFLFEWWCLFWDMYKAQRGTASDLRNASQYLAHTQAQSRLRQENQQQMLRNMRPDMIPNSQQYQMMMRNQQQQNGMNLKQNDIARTAMQNNRNATPQQQMAMLQQQQQKQQQMQRDPSDSNHPRPQSPGSGENAPSPSKRPRLDGAPFNPQQAMMPNGRGQTPGMQANQVGNTGPSNAIQNAQMQLPNGFDASNLTPQQFQAFQGQNQGAAQQKSLAAYQASLTQHTQGQMPSKGMANPGGPQSQGSPMMPQGQDGGAIAGYYNAGEMGPNGMRGAPGGQPNGGGNHALQDYQMQLMLLEQQNKKRLMMARQEQDSMSGPREGMPGVGPGGPGGPGPNGQPFQGTSPQGARSGASPNPSEPIKRGTPHMNNAGIPSPLPEGQSRGSPNGMNFMPGGQMDPNMAPQFNGMNGMNMMPNGMRPPSSHPGAFNGQMTPAQQQQMAMARQAQAQQQAANGWQSGPNGTPMMPTVSQGPPPQMGTPQQRAMPPPSAPAAGAAGNGRTQPSSPQQGAAPPTPSQANKANPKGKKDANKDTKAKKGGKKGQAPTPAADASQEPATPTPATPITPVHPKSFNGQNGAVQPMANGQPPAATTAPAQQPDPLGAIGFDQNGPLDFQGFEFTNPTAGNMDVLQDFDFDSFLHQDGEGVDNFSFDTSAFLDGGEIGAE